MELTHLNKVTNQNLKKFMKAFKSDKLTTHKNQLRKEKARLPKYFIIEKSSKLTYLELPTDLNLKG